MTVGIVYIAGVAFVRFSNGTLLQIGEIALAGPNPDVKGQYVVVLKNALQYEIQSEDVDVILRAIESLTAYTISGK